MLHFESTVTSKTPLDKVFIPLYSAKRVIFYTILTHNKVVTASLKQRLLEKYLTVPTRNFQYFKIINYINLFDLKLYKTSINYQFLVPNNQIAVFWGKTKSHSLKLTGPWGVDPKSSTHPDLRLHRWLQRLRQTDSMWSLNKQWRPVVLERLPCVPALLCAVNIPVRRAQRAQHTLTELHEKPRPVRDDLVIQPVKWVRAGREEEEVALCSMLHA